MSQEARTFEDAFAESAMAGHLFMEIALSDGGKERHRARVAATREWPDGGLHLTLAVPMHATYTTRTNEPITVLSVTFRSAKVHTVEAFDAHFMEVPLAGTVTLSVQR